jgi:16S rRNA processing protein RimM
VSVAAEAREEAWDDHVLVGRVARAHGNRGQVIVNPETDFLEARFRPGAVLRVMRGGIVEALRVTEVRFQRGRPIVAFEGVATMNEAEAMAGLELRVPSADLEPLPQGVFYRHDLVGCRVETVSGSVVGEVSAVEGDYGASRLVLRRPDGEVLIPLAAHICVRVDTASRLIVIDPPEGLIELNRRRA